MIMASKESFKNCQLWDSCLKYISLRVKKQSYNTWFRPTYGKQPEQDRLNIIVPNQFVADWLDRHYSDLICEAISETNGRALDYKIETGLTPASIPQTEIDFRPRPAAPIASRSDGSLGDRYRFDNFVVGSFNQFAHAAAMAVAESPGETSYNPLFIYGGSGLGKTHLLQAIGHNILNNLQGKKILYASSEKFTSDFIAALSNGTAASFTAKYRNVDVLLIDDIQFFSRKESTQEQFFHTFNDLYHAGKQIVLTSDRHPKDTRGLEERLLSRFSSGLVADLQAPDLETRVAILRMRTDREKITVPDDVLYFIADNVTSNIRELEGHLNRLLAYASLEKVGIDLEFAQRVLGKDIFRPRKEITVAAIQKKTADFFKIEQVMMISKKKTSQVAQARQVAMFLTRKHTRLSLKSIGEAFGGRDHSTVIHACDLISKKIEEDLDLRLKVESLSSALLS